MTVGKEYEMKRAPVPIKIPYEAIVQRTYKVSGSLEIEGYSRIREISETSHKGNPEAGLVVRSRPWIELVKIRFSRWHIVRLDMSDMMIKFLVVLGVFLECLEWDALRTIEAGFHNDEKSAEEEKSCEAGQDVIEETPGARVEHVSCRDRSEASQTQRGSIITDLCTTFVEEEAIVHNLEVRINSGARGFTMTATDSQIPAPKQPRIWNTKSCS